MIILFIILYIFAGFLTYESLSVAKDWPDLFDYLEKDERKHKSQKEINSLVLSVTFWPVWAVIGALYVIYIIIKAICWFFKNLYIAFKDLFGQIKITK